MKIFWVICLSINLLILGREVWNHSRPLVILEEIAWVTAVALTVAERFTR